MLIYIRIYFQIYTAVREEIDEDLVVYYDKVLDDEIAGTLRTFVVSKAYVDSLSWSAGMLTDVQANALH